MSGVKVINRCRRDDSAVLAFVHLPKSAGSTLHSILVAQYSDRKHVSSSGFKTLNELLQLDKSELNEIGVVRGHMNYGIHKFFEAPCNYVTVLRDPVGRAKSHYYYLQSASHHPLHEQFKQTRFSFREFITMMVDNDNGQTRALAGVNCDLAFDSDKNIGFGGCTESVYEAAIENLNNFAVVGLQEHFDESLILMKRALGWETPPVYISQNVSDSKPENDEVTDVDIEIFKNLNKYDLRLYEYAKNLFENRVLAEGISFPLELEYFQATNKFFQKEQILDALYIKDITFFRTENEQCRAENEQYKAENEGYIAENEGYKAENEGYIAENEGYRAEIALLHQTLSWRITAPLRTLRRLWSRLTSDGQNTKKPS